MRSEIVNAILEGIYEGHRIQWARAGQSIFWPAESVYLSRIADALDKVGYKYMNYEYRVNKLIKELGLLPDQHVIASNGKIDLLIRDKEKQPLVIVEIKAEYHQESALEKDLFRICDLLCNRSTGKNPNLFGVFAVGLVRFDVADIRNHITESFRALEEKVVRVKTKQRGCSCTSCKRNFEDKGNIV
jgi:hypothetical protein